MSGELAGEDRVVRAHLLLDEGMPHAAHHRLSAGRRYRLFDHLRRAQVVEARGAGVRRQKVLRNQRGHEVHRNDLAKLVDEAGAVRIAVEGHSEGVLAGIVADKRLKVLQRLHVKRIRVMVRKIPVVVAIERIIGNVRPGECRTFGDSHAVCEVKRKMERTLHMGELADVRGILRRDINLRYFADAPRRLAANAIRDKLFDVLDARRA